MRASTSKWTGALVIVALAACGDPRFSLAPATRPRGPDRPTSVAAGDQTGGAPVRWVRPRPGLTDLRLAPIERHRVVSGGRALVVRFWSGAPPCTRLTDAGATSSRRAVRIRVLVGSEPSPPDQACPEIALLLATKVRLEDPLAGRRVLYGGP